MNKRSNRWYKLEIKKSIRRVENLPMEHFKNKSLIKLKNLI